MRGSEDVNVVITTSGTMEAPRAPPLSRNTPAPPKLKSVGDAYVLGFPLGVLGTHHFYLGSPGLGLAYLFTLGCGGIGWVADWFRMPMLVKDANRIIEKKWKMKNELMNEDVRRYELDSRRLSDCYVLGFATGILGLHHFYLKRPGWGILYLFTLGLMGVGLLVDWLRMPVLFKRYKSDLKKKTKGIDEGISYERHLDDAYVLAFPFGLLGFHHFYLNRPCWGFLYLFTFGMLGLGMLIDLLRMNSLVNDCNRRLKAQTDRQRLVSGNGHVGCRASTYSTNTVPPPTAQYNMPPPGAPGPYQSPYPGDISASGLPSGYALPPHSAGSDHVFVPPPPYTPTADAASVMPDPDGVPVEKPPIKEYGSAAQPPSAPIETKKKLY